MLNVVSLDGSQQISISNQSRQPWDRGSDNCGGRNPTGPRCWMQLPHPSQRDPNTCEEWKRDSGVSGFPNGRSDDLSSECRVLESVSRCRGCQNAEKKKDQGSECSTGCLRGARWALRTCTTTQCAVSTSIGNQSPSPSRVH